MIRCPGCGQGLRFDVPSQQMVCDYCGASCDPASTAALNKNAEGHSDFEGYVFSCPSCGGELLTTDPNDAIGFCPYCGGASMLYDRVHAQWEAKSVIPFKITKEQCREAYLKKAKRSIFTSAKYRDPKLIERFRGIYMPYWSYHAVQDGPFTLHGDKYNFATIDTYRVTGETRIELDGYGHDASAAFDDRTSEDLSPFDLSEAKPFAPGYLSGFYADLGDVEQSTFRDAVAGMARRETARALSQHPDILRPDEGPSRLHPIPATVKLDTEITDAEMALYPIWFMSYRNKEKITYAAVNGQTGKVSADLPVSPWRILLAVLLAGVLLAAGLLFLPSIKANWTLAASALLLGAGYFVLRRLFNSTVRDNGLADTPEAKRFKKRELWPMLAVILSVTAALVVTIIDPAYNWISYAGCFLLAGVLFWVMLRHIRFQAEIARREPPQFGKKGAAYDEN